MKKNNNFRFIERHTVKLNKSPKRAAEKIDCPFSMPMSRKEQPTMTKPREKTREELQAEIEDGKKKIRQLENREKVLRQKLSQEERRTRSHRLIVRGAVFESIVPEAKDMTDEEAAALLRLALTSEPAREYLKKTSRKRERQINPFGTKGALIHPSSARLSSAKACFLRCRRVRPLFSPSPLSSIPRHGTAKTWPCSRAIAVQMPA